MLLLQQKFGPVGFWQDHNDPLWDESLHGDFCSREGSESFPGFLKSYLQKRQITGIHPSMDRKAKNIIMDMLGDELLVLILEKLQDSADRKSWCLVCKHFFHLEAKSRNKVQLTRSELLPRILNRYSRIKHLDLSLCSQITDSSLVHVGRILGRHLVSINLSRVCNLSPGGLDRLLKNCVNLVEIDLSNCCAISDYAAQAIASASKLRSLNLEKCRQITDMGICCIAAGCTALQTLNLRWCVGVTDWSVELLAKKCRQLLNLDVSYTEITDKCLPALTNLNHLKTLALMGCGGVSDVGLSCLRKSLQRLDVSRCPNVSYTGLISVASCSSDLRQLTLGCCIPITGNLLESFQNFDRLHTIKFDGCQISGNVLESVGKSCKSLRELSLSKCTGVTDAGLSAVVACCCKLNKLDLTCCRDLTDVGISSVAKECRYLSSLKLESCSLITEKSFVLLGESCHFLQELDLTDCGINDKVLESLSRCSELITLKLGFCQDISDKGIIQIGAHCSCLQELDFYRSVGVGDAGLAAIANGCPSLRSINISYCTKVTDNGLRSLAQLQRIHNFEIRGCVKISSAGVSAVALGCKGIVELDIKRCYGIDDVGIISIAESCQNLRQINISYSSVSDTGLSALAQLKCLQNVKAVHIRNVTRDGYVFALNECKSLKKVKLLKSLKKCLTPNLVKQLQIRGCNIRWMDKPFVI